MMKTLLVAALLSSATVASAKPVMVPAPSAPLLIPAPLSHQRGSTLIEIRHGSDTSTKLETLRVTADGRVLSITRDRRRLTTRVIDRLSSREVRTIRKALRAATWQTTTSQIRCFAYSPEYTDYVVGGDVMFRAQMCSGTTADEATQRAIATIEAIVAR